MPKPFRFGVIARGARSGSVWAEHVRQAEDSALTRIRRLEEAVRLIKQCLTPQTVSFSGSYYTVTGLEHQQLPLQRPHPPIFLGGGGKHMLQLSAREGDIIGIAPKYGPHGPEASELTSEATERKIAWTREAAGERFEHLELSCTLFQVLIGTAHQPAAGSRQASGLSMPLPPGSIHAAIGSVDQVVEELLARRARYGISYLQVFEAQMEPFAPVVARLAGK